MTNSEVPGNTLDPLLDFKDSHPTLHPSEEAILFEAWEQHDLYPCKSGEQVREAIISEALGAVSMLVNQREVAAEAIKRMAQGSREKTVYVVSSHPVGHRDSA